MQTTSSPKTTLWSRLVVAPAVVGLVSASVIVGYASNDLLPYSGGHARIAPERPYRASEEISGTEEAVAQDAADVNPLNDYKIALGLIKNRYYGASVDNKKTRQLTYEAIHGMLGSLRDRFTRFMDPDEWSQFHDQTQGDFEGIGAFLLEDGLFIKIQQPVETGPAEKAGIKAGDTIVSVDGKSIKGMDINNVVRRIKGKRGTKVMLGILRDKKPLTFLITRAIVEPPIVQFWMEDGEARIGHIVLKDFNEKAVQQLERAYRDLSRQGMRALVFDLRYNPGGLLDTAIDVASLLIPRDHNDELNNVVVFIREGSEGREQARTLVGARRSHRPLPMVVLVNEESASASEIVTGAIQDYGLGTIMGERTYGKGKVQSLWPLDNGRAGALSLTTAIYLSPKRRDVNFLRDEDGRKVEGTGGILPDIEVKQSPKWKAESFKDKANDAQLQKALTFLRAKLNGLTTAQATDEIRRIP